MPTEIIKTFKGWPQVKNKFMAFIPKECFLPENKDKCWEWQGGKTGAGYGVITWGKKDQYGAHRMSYFIFKGNIPKEQLIRHTCDNRSCVNPNHLLLGSVSDNSIDMVNRNRQRNQKLNDEAVKVIKWMLKYRPEKGLGSKLAKFYKVKKETISHINCGRIWGHIKV